MITYRRTGFRVADLALAALGSCQRRSTHGPTVFPRTREPGTAREAVRWRTWVARARPL